MAVRISAVICTLNRAGFLPKAIQSVVDQTLDSGEYEIVVVDNGSTDNTGEMVYSEFSSVQNLRYLVEPVLGLSRARNRGWREARGEYVAFLDDDAIAYRQWLERIVDVFETVEPTPGCVGGRIEPMWEVPPPAWIPDELRPYLTVLDWGDEPKFLTGDQAPAGANVAFPKELLRALGGFGVRLGRKGGKLLSLEEIRLLRQLEERGYGCYYHPEIAVRHHIPASRLTKRWFLRRMYWEGVSEAIAWMQDEPLSSADRLGKGLGGLVGALVSPRRLLNLVVPTGDPDRFRLKCSTMRRIGHGLGYLGIAR
jgi:glycosyltransferase involved in cell wall biosynthesis